MELLIIGTILYLIYNGGNNNMENQLSIKNGNTFNDLVKLAKAKGFTVTSTTGGKHNSGSKHAKGLAIDVRTKDKKNAQIVEFMAFARSFGVRVLDERVRPAGQKVWGGAHLHLELI